MIAKKCSKEEIYQAVRQINTKYKENITFNREPEAIGKRFRFTLRVKDSKKEGAKTGYTGRRTINACWHTHGDLFDKLFEINPEAQILAGGNTISKEGGNWQDRNIGSIMTPLYYSEACNC